MLLLTSDSILPLASNLHTIKPHTAFRPYNSSLKHNSNLNLNITALDGQKNQTHTCAQNKRHQPMPITQAKLRQLYL